MSRSAKPDQESDYIGVHKSQNAEGYPSDLYIGKDAKIYQDASADFERREGRCQVLHQEKPSGYAGTHMAV